MLQFGLILFTWHLFVCFFFYRFNLTDLNILKNKSSFLHTGVICPIPPRFLGQSWCSDLLALFSENIILCLRCHMGVWLLCHPHVTLTASHGSCPAHSRQLIVSSHSPSEITNQCPARFARPPALLTEHAQSLWPSFSHPIPLSVSLSLMLCMWLCLLWLTRG